LTHQIDVYSTANILFAILTGEHPWHGINIEEVKSTVRKGGRPRILLPSDSSNKTDAVLARVIERAYNVDPESRISAKELWEDLETGKASI